MSVIAISFTPNGGSAYNFTFSQFTDAGLARSYANSNDISYSVNGTALVGGYFYQQRRIWAISSPLINATAQSFDEMFRAWDLDRSNGRAVAIGLIDQTFGSEVTTNVVFSTAPSYSKFGPRHMLVSFGLTEI